MKVSKNFLALAGIAGLAFGAVTLNASASTAASDTKVLSEHKAASFNVGTKKAVAFYIKDAGQCNVTVMMSETYSEQLPYDLATVRFTSKVAPNTTSEVVTSDGSKLALSCAQNASNLIVEGLEQVAYSRVETTN